LKLIHFQVKSTDGSKQGPQVIRRCILGLTAELNRRVCH